MVYWHCTHAEQLWVLAPNGLQTPLLKKFSLAEWEPPPSEVMPNGARHTSAPPALRQPVARKLLIMSTKALPPSFKVRPIHAGESPEDDAKVRLWLRPLTCLACPLTAQSCSPQPPVPENMSSINHL